MSGLSWSSHSVILRETVLKGYLIAQSPLRIGAGTESPLGSAVDLAVLRINLDGKWVPYIPGGSLKGVFRSTAVQLAKDKDPKVCSGLSKQTCMDRKDSEFDEPLLKKIQKEMSGGNVGEALRSFHEKTCLLCKVFGAPSFAGHAEFNDAYPVNENGDVQDILTWIRTGIAINRRTGAVHGSQLYQVEYVESGARFRFSIRTTNLPNYALGLLAKVLRMLNDGWVRIGGFKTRGFGEVKVEGLRFTTSGPTVQGAKMLVVDDKDIELDLAGHVSSTPKGLEASGDEAWAVLAKLEEVWEGVRLG